MAVTVNRVNQDAPAWQVSLNTPIIQAITSTEFDMYLGQINAAYYTEREVFTWINLAYADTDTATIVLDIVSGENILVDQTFTMRVGSFLPVRAVRVKTGTDPTALLNVGVWN